MQSPCSPVSSISPIPLLSQVFGPSHPSSAFPYSHLPNISSTLCRESPSFFYIIFILNPLNDSVRAVRPDLTRPDQCWSELLNKVPCDAICKSTQGKTVPYPTSTISQAIYPTRVRGRNFTLDYYLISAHAGTRQQPLSDWSSAGIGPKRLTLLLGQLIRQGSIPPFKVLI